MKKSILFLVSALMVVGASVTVVNAAKKNGDRLVLEGSTTVLPIAQRGAEDFMNAHSGIDISVRGGGSGVGITSLLSKTCDIAAS